MQFEKNKYEYILKYIMNPTRSLNRTPLLQTTLQ